MLAYWSTPRHIDLVSRLSCQDYLLQVCVIFLILYLCVLLLTVGIWFFICSFTSFSSTSSFGGPSNVRRTSTSTKIINGNRIKTTRWGDGLFYKLSWKYFSSQLVNLQVKRSYFFAASHWKPFEQHTSSQFI